MFSAAQIENFTSHLYEIRDELLLNKKELAGEIWWPTPYYLNPETYAFEERYDIFNGNCGIVLFFLELYRFDQNEASLELIDKVMARIYKSEAIQKPVFFACYTGMGGVIYTSIKIFEVTGDIKYKDEALKLALTYQKQLTIELLKADLLSGYTGNLLVLTLLYHHTENKVVLGMVKLLIDRLISEARISAKGLKWDYSRSKKAYDSMTGFSHGASGIAYVLMQVSRYFEIPGLLYLAEEALAYEMQYFHAPAKNWLDLRLGPHRLNKPDVHEWQLNTFIADMTDVNAWAHGAAGVGLARYEAFSLTTKNIYQKHCTDALNRCLADIAKLERADFTLVSGYLGMVPFLLKCNEQQNGAFSHEITAIINLAREQHQKTKSYNAYTSCGLADYGLFSGKSGVGYVLLHLLMNQKSDAVMLPKLPRANKPSVIKEMYTVQRIKREIFSRYYQQTIDKVKNLDRNFSPEMAAQNIDAFKRKLEEKIDALTSEQKDIKQLFDLETEKLKLWKQHKGHFCHQQRNVYLNKKAEEADLINNEELLNRNLKLSSYAKYYEFGENAGKFLLICNENEVSELKIGALPGVILKIIANKPVKIAKLIEFIAENYVEKPFDSAKITLLHSKVLEQIRLLVKSGVVALI